MKFPLYDEESQKRASIAIANFPLNGRRMYAEIKEVDERRRSAQNNLLWKWNSEIQAFMAEHYGQIASAEEWHDVMTRKLMPVAGKTVKLPDGEQYEAGRWQSSRASVKEMTEYLNRLDGYCACMGLLLSHPDDLYREAMSRRAA